MVYFRFQEHFEDTKEVVRSSRLEEKKWQNEKWEKHKQWSVKHFTEK